MKISRRSFLKWCTASAAALGVTKLELDRLESVVLAAETTPPVIWLQGSGCSGCSISLLNSVEGTTVEDLLINKISMKYHHNLMAAAGDMAITSINNTVAQYDGRFVLIVEGAVPTANNGMYCVLGEKDGRPWTMLDAVKQLGPKASYVIAAGTCATYGGVPKLGANPAVIKKLDTEILYGQTKNKIINLPGCPVHPYTLTKTIIDLLLYGMPALDSEGRPTAYYKSSVHSMCPRRGTSGAKQLGEFGCYKSQGCKGPQTYNNCPLRQWNNKVNWCIGAGHHCIACSSKDFLANPIYKFV
ncbi:hydrogenase small subunit [Clostridium pascui]|uniref:hydrogenase small subunit n=1 Tax=Clostridium pascui TaxID=46609 RepID=UPI00195C20BE|nr:hydrogenase small subunit [Clostridium pascui]MBM7869015.1 hydrogenase small subunit [Clostridium pascui]